MYGNETVSSVSVKSGGSYTREDSIDVYDVSSRRLGLPYLFVGSTLIHHSRAPFQR